MDRYTKDSEGRILRHVITRREGRLYSARALIAVTGSTAADAVIFAMLLKAISTRRCYIEQITGSVIFNGTAAAATQQGVYFERYQTKSTGLTGGTDITVFNAQNSGDPSDVTYAQFKVDGITTTSLATLEGSRFGGALVAASATGPGASLYHGFPQDGAELWPGQGLLCRLSYQAITGLFVDLTVQWREYDTPIVDGGPE